MTPEQVSVVRQAHFMLNSLTQVFKNPSTNDPIRQAASAGFNLLLDRARKTFPEIDALTSIPSIESRDTLQGLIALLSLLVGALPYPGKEETRMGF
jgi:hypothetical protein